MLNADGCGQTFPDTFPKFGNNCACLPSPPTSGMLKLKPPRFAAGAIQIGVFRMIPIVLGQDTGMILGPEQNLHEVNAV